MDEDATVMLAADNLDITLAAEIIAAYVSNNSIPAAELPALITSIHAALKGLGQSAPTEAQIDRPTPAQIRKSITPDSLISFVDNKPYKTLKRHLTGHGLTMEAYRERYGLAKDYPAVAANYSAARSSLAKSLGLGRPRKGPATPELAADVETVAQAPKKPGRPRKPKKVERAEVAE